MATPFEGFSLVENFSFIFPFLLVFLLVAGILTWIKPFGDNKGINWMVALVLAVITLFSPIVRESISTMAPWFILLFFFIIFTLVAFKIFGFSDASIMGAMSGRYTYINFWVIALVIIIGIGSLMHVISEMGGLGPSGVEGGANADAGNAASSEVNVQSPDQESAFWSTLVHPKVLGFILIMLIAMFTIQRLSAAA